MNPFKELEWRGLVDNITSPEVKDATVNEKLDILYWDRSNSG